MAEQIQWQFCRQSYFFRPLYLPLRLLNRLKIKRNTRLKAASGWTRCLNPLIAGMMMLDYFLVPEGVPGSSLLVCLSPSAEYLRHKRLNARLNIIASEILSAAPEEVSV